MRAPQTESHEDKVVLDLLEEKFGLSDLSVWDLRCVAAAMYALKHLPTPVPGGEAFTYFDVTERLADDLRFSLVGRWELAEWDDARFVAERNARKVKAEALAAAGGRCTHHMWRKSRGRDQPQCMACGAIRE